MARTGSSVAHSGSSRFAVACGTDVVTAPGKKNAVDAGEELSHAFAGVGEMELRRARRRPA